MWKWKKTRLAKREPLRAIWPSLVDDVLWHHFNALCLLRQETDTFSQGSHILFHRPSQKCYLWIASGGGRSVCLNCWQSKAAAGSKSSCLELLGCSLWRLKSDNCRQRMRFHRKEVILFRLGKMEASVIWWIVEVWCCWDIQTVCGLFIPINLLPCSGYSKYKYGYVTCCLRFQYVNLDAVKLSPHHLNCWEVSIKPTNFLCLGGFLCSPKNTTLRLNMLSTNLCNSTIW